MGLISLDLGAIQQAPEELVADLTRRPEIVWEALFESLATGGYAPGNDVDILVPISDSDKPYRQRIPDY